MSSTDDRLRDHFHGAAATAAADDALLDSLRAEAQRRRHRRRITSTGVAAAAAAAAVVLGIAVTSTGDDGREDVDVVASTTTSSTGSTSTTTTSTSTPPARDWDGARFDFGRIERVRRENGTWLVDFDRTQLHTGDGLQSGPDFTQEPVVVGNTDEPTVNENRRLRTYAFRPDAEVLVVANLSDTCSGNEQPQPPRWRPLTLDGLSSDRELWDELTQVAITFDPQGLVLRIRLASGC